MERGVLNRKLKITLSSQQYENIRTDLCHVERTIRAEISEEMCVRRTCNNPLFSDEHVDYAAYCSFADDGYLRVWTDGSANKDEDYVAYAVFWGENHPLNYACRLDAITNTNNNAEMEAVAHAIRSCPPGQKLLILTDSQVTMSERTPETTPRRGCVWPQLRVHAKRQHTHSDHKTQHNGVAIR